MTGRPERSLLGRIAIGLVAVSLVAVVLAGGLFYLQFGDTDTGLRERTLHAQVLLIARFIDGTKDWRTAPLPKDLADSLMSSDSRFAVLDADGRLLRASDGVTIPFHPVESTHPRTAEYFVRSQPRGRDIFGVTEPAEEAGQRVWIQVASDDEDIHIDAVVEEFVVHLGWIWGPFVFGLLGINLLIVHRALRPLRLVSAKAAAIGPGAVSERLPLADLPREIAPLITSVNSALDRLEEGYRAQQDFLADAAHDLRTPLAVLCAHLATLDGESAAALRQDADSMVRLVNQLLDLARLGALQGEPFERMDLHALAVEVATQLAPLALARGRLIEVVGDEGPVPVAGMRDGLFRAVRNLAENALAYSPEGGTVSIAVSRAPSIAVSDQGPGIPPERREAIFRRHWRGDHDRGGGAGLGLAIVARTMDIHGGRVEVGDAPGGGAVITLRFPP
ncbi:sensor histidine kinase [Telmatospirillum siberiense]|uniref:histidine kinase n=1 Tax=Telmatospirillum siberiense TaxID=382514 RepID=A0A2N3Q1E7_9PROT|nr:ATP-binding protein [Telmatospirillum siberiense]PKU26474.1 two-component sensor histidine kinase [Telmatospirillum siberiense]